MDLPDAQYGEAATFRADQQGAPMGSPAAAPQGGGGQMPDLIPLHAPSTRPDEPVTAGAAAGPGVGPEALGLGPGMEPSEDLDRLRSYLPTFIAMANRPEAGREFRLFVRSLRAKLGA